jgi:hypothetical protein
MQRLVYLSTMDGAYEYYQRCAKCDLFDCSLMLTLFAIDNLIDDNTCRKADGVCERMEGNETLLLLLEGLDWK